MHEFLNQAELLQKLHLLHVTGGSENDANYRDLRQIFMSGPALERLLPRFIRQCRSLYHFWEFIKHKSAHYNE